MSAASVLSRDECSKIVQRYLQRDDFELKSFAVSPLSEEMKGFMGDYLKLRVSVTPGGQNNQNAETVEMLFFVKSVPLDDAYRRNLVLSTVAYQKEVLFYSDLVRGLQKYLRCPDYEASTWLGTVPQCYYSRPDLLVLEDVSLSGFRMLDPRGPLSVAQCECVLRALARLHAGSLVFEEREGRRLADAYPLLLEETLYRKHAGFPLYDAHVSCRGVVHFLLDLVPRFAPGTPQNEELHSLLEPTLEEIYHFLKPSDTYRNVLCHRDLWINNMLFAEDGRGELSVRLVDFQTLRLEPPARDVMMFLHLATMRDLRRTHGRRLLELYHQTLGGVLRQHDLDVDSLLPLQVFLQSCEDIRPEAVVVAAYILQVAMMPLQKDTDIESFILDWKDMAKAAYQCDERFHNRMTELMEELVETCLLPRLKAQQ